MKCGNRMLRSSFRAPERGIEDVPLWPSTASWLEPRKPGPYCAAGVWIDAGESTARGQSGQQEVSHCVLSEYCTCTAERVIMMEELDVDPAHVRCPLPWPGHIRHRSSQ